MLNKPDIATFDISNYKICEKNDIKYLSITLDNKLSWQPDIAKWTARLSKPFEILSKQKHYTAQPSLKVVYNALIHTYLNFSVLNWGGKASEPVLNLFWIYKIKLWNFWKHPTKPLWMKLRPVDRFQRFGGQNTFLWGKIFAFIVCFNKKYSGEKIWDVTKKMWEALPSNSTLWSRAWWNLYKNHILTINKPFKMYAGKFTHSYENNLLLSHLNQCFKSIQTIHDYHTRLATSQTFFTQSKLFSRAVLP